MAGSLVREFAHPGRVLWWSLIALPLALWSCSDGGGSHRAAGDGLQVDGVVLDPSGDPVSQVKVTVPATGSSVQTDVDGSFTARVPEDDPRLQVGGLEESAYVVRLDVDDGGGVAVGEASEILRPFFLERSESGLVGEVPAERQGEAGVLEDVSLPGLLLTLSADTRVSYPAGAREEVFLVGLPNDRLPLPLPGGLFVRTAVMVGPIGVEFEPPAKLFIPNTEGLAPGTVLDLVVLDEATGLWQIQEELLVTQGGVAVGPASITRGGLVAALPRSGPATTTITGRILGSGNEPVEGFRVVTPAGHAGVSGIAGFFVIPDVPVPAGFEFRVQVISPRTFRHEFLLSGLRAPVAGGETDFGVVPVRSVLRSGIPPAVIYTPSRDAQGVSEIARARVRFGHPMDLDSIGIKVVRGVSREQRGVEGVKLMRFVDGGAGVELEFIPSRPLQNGTFYTIFLPVGARDLEGNVIEREDASSRFYVRDAPDDPEDGVLRLHFARNLDRSPEYLEGIAGDEVEIIGDNLFNEEVRFGSAQAFVRDFELDFDSRDPRGRDRLVVVVPREISGEVNIKVKDLDGNLKGSLPFRAVPFIDALAEGAAAPLEGSLRVTGRGLHLGSSPDILWNGVGGGGFSLVDPSESCPPELELQCFAVDLPAGVSAGTLFLDVSGMQTRGRLIVTLQPPP